jgi:PAS domain S-box-containing protein
MSQLPDHVLVSRVAAALAGSDAEDALERALATLRASGFVTDSTDAGVPWLRVEHAGRVVALDVGLRPPDATLRETLRSLLSAALMRAAAEDELCRTRERMDMLSAASFEGIFIHVDGVIIDANQRVAELLGCTLAEVLGSNTLLNCAAPEDLPAVLERMQNRFEGTYVITAVRKDGSRFRAELQSKQGKLGTRPVRVVAVRDVTERERTQALVRESETRLRDLAQQAFDFTVVSRNGVAIEVAGDIERVLGFTPEEVVGKRLIDYVAPVAVPLGTRILAEPILKSNELILVSKTGEQVPVEILAVMSTLDGEPVRVGGARDLREARRLENERRRLNEQLQRSQRLESLGVLAGGIAHDFNNLLVGVLGNAELLQGSLSQAEDRELCDAIISAAERAADLTTQLLAYAGQRDLGQRHAVDLAALWRELGTLLEARLSARAQLELSLGEGSVVLGDRATLTQVLMNLLTNASDALEDKSGTIWLSTSRIRNPDARWDRALGATVGPGDWVQVEVRDSGAGMDSSTLQRVFEPFFSTKAQGHGLGLASCLGIVSAHGGAVAVESEPGQGSRFSILLPAAERSASEAPRPQARGAVTPCKVLVVDDEAVVRSLLRRSLERRGYQVLEASNGQAGLGAIREGSPDLVVLDMSMPEMDGAEVVRLARAEGFTLPIVITSGYLDTFMERRLTPGSFQSFLRKPFSMQELVAAVEAALLITSG